MVPIRRPVRSRVAIAGLCAALGLAALAGGVTADDAKPASTPAKIAVKTAADSAAAAKATTGDGAKSTATAPAAAATPSKQEGGSAAVKPAAKPAASTAKPAAGTTASKATATKATTAKTTATKPAASKASATAKPAEAAKKPSTAPKTATVVKKVAAKPAQTAAPAKTTAASPAPAKSAKKTVKKAVAPAPQEERITYHYNALGRRDPFKALINGPFVGVDEGANAPPDLGAIQVVGIVWGASDKFAMVEDPRGNSLVLRRGDKVMNGVVTGIRRDAIVVEHEADGQSRSVVIPLTRKGDNHDGR